MKFGRICGYIAPKFSFCEDLAAFCKYLGEYYTYYAINSLNLKNIVLILCFIVLYFHNYGRYYAY